MTLYGDTWNRTSYNDFYFQFKNTWHRVTDYINEDLRAEVLSHKCGLFPRRQSITQAEFENICINVLSHQPDVKYTFEEGTIHLTYPSHTGRSSNGSTLYFGQKGYITHIDRQYAVGSNYGTQIGEEIAKRIEAKMYE